MDFFRKLQEATDISNVAGNEADPGGAGVGSVSAAGSSGGGGGGGGAGNNADAAAAAAAREAMSRDELLVVLRQRDAELHLVRNKWIALRSETQAVQDEYSAYKTKVATWREQMKSARQQDRRTIELLRAEVNTLSSGAGGGGGGGGSSAAGEGGGGGGGGDATYMASLEEQVRALKETIREYGSERDKLELELQRVRKQVHLLELRHHEEEVVESAGHPAAAVSGAASAGGGDSAVAAPVEHRHHDELVRRAAQATEMAAELERLRKQVTSLEGAVEQLTDEAAQSSKALVEAMERHRAEVRELEVQRDSDKQQQYIRDLEKELAQWRKRDAVRGQQQEHQQHQQQQEQPQQTDVETSSGEASTEEYHRSSPQRAPAGGPDARSGASGGNGAEAAAALERALQTISQLEGRVAQLQEKVSHKDETVARLDGLVAELQAERAAQDANVDSLFDENAALQRRVEELGQLLALEKESGTELRQALRSAEEQLLEMREALAVSEEREHSAQRAATRAQRDLADRNEAFRLLRQEYAKQQHQQAVGCVPEGSVGVVIAGPGGGAVEATPKKQEKGGSNPTSCANTERASSDSFHEEAYALPFNFSRSSFAQSSLTLEQVKALWGDMMNRQRAMFTTTRLRMYIAVAVLVAFILLFSFYQSNPIMEDGVLEAQLLECREALRTLKGHLRASASPASGDGANVQ